MRTVRHVARKGRSTRRAPSRNGSPSTDRLLMWFHSYAWLEAVRWYRATGHPNPDAVADRDARERTRRFYLDELHVAFFRPWWVHLPLTVVTFGLWLPLYLAWGMLETDRRRGACYARLLAAPAPNTPGWRWPTRTPQPPRWRFTLY